MNAFLNSRMHWISNATNKLFHSMRKKGWDALNNLNLQVNTYRWESWIGQETAIFEHFSEEMSS